jgi:hypothetical protein
VCAQGKEGLIMIKDVKSVTYHDSGCITLSFDVDECNSEFETKMDNREALINKCFPEDKKEDLNTHISIRKETRLEKFFEL